MKNLNAINKWGLFVEKVYQNDPFFSMHTKKFNLAKNSKVFTIGSCFARSIEEALANDFQFPITQYVGDDNEYKARRKRGILNKFTPSSILHELNWLLNIFDGADFTQTTKDFFSYKVNEEYYIDLGLQHYVPINKERFLNRRKEIYNIYSELKHCDSIIITFGLIEEWKFKKNPIQHAPNRKEMLKKDNNKFIFNILTINDTEKIISEIIDKLFLINQKIKVILTVSPVPLEATFSNEHILVANSLSKSTLRSSLKNLVDKKNVDYFPSYEMVNAYGPNAFEKDLRHVKSEIVQNVFNIFKKTYF